MSANNNSQGKLLDLNGATLTSSGSAGSITTTNLSGATVIGSAGTLYGGSGGYATTVPNNNYQGYVSTPLTYSYTYPIVTKYALQVERVENGWIVEKDGKKFVITQAEEILQYLQQDTKKNKKVK